MGTLDLSINIAGWISSVLVGIMMVQVYNWFCIVVSTCLLSVIIEPTFTCYYYIVRLKTGKFLVFQLLLLFFVGLHFMLMFSG